MYSTPELITALAARGVLPQADADRFRRLHDDAPADFGPRVLLKWLVNRGRLNVEQADRLAAGMPGKTADEALDRLLGNGGDLELAPLDDDERDDIPLADETPANPSRSAASAGPSQASPSPEAPSPPAARPPAGRSSAAPSAPGPSAGAGAKSPTSLPDPGGFDSLLSELPATLPSLSRPKRKGWDTPLMLAGGGGLILLILGGVFLWWRLGRQSGDDAFAAAEEAYVKASYVTAVERFDRYLENFAEHPSAGTAVVHRGLAKIRIDVEAGDDWNRTLATAQKVLPEIASQTEFATSKNDLRALLPEIVEQLARQSLEMSDAGKLEAAREAKRLFDRYLADDPQAPARGAELDDVLTLADRRLERERRITAAAQAMRTAGEKSDAAGAFAARDALLAEFPDAATAPKLVEAAAAVAKAAAAAVAPVDEPVEAEHAERPAPQIDRTTLVRYASTTTPPAESPSAGGQVAVARSGGTAFALDAATGRLRWRRNVGFDGRFEPVVLGEGANRGILLDDGRELVAVDEATGKLRWRLPAKGAEAWPVVAGKELLVTLREGRILVVDVASGKSTGSITFPEELIGGAVADAREQVRYQLARDGRLYVLDAGNRTCLEAIHLGHRAGSIRPTPLSIGPYLVLVEQTGDRSRIRLLKGDEAGRNVAEVGTYAAPDPISSTPAAARRLMAVVGDRGSVTIFDLTRSDPAEAIKPIITRPAAGAEGLIRYAAMRGGEVWLSGPHLEQAVVEASVGKLTTAHTWVADGPALQAPQWIGARLVDFHDDGAGGLRASAYEAGARQPLWETWVSMSLNSPPNISPDGGRLNVIAGNRLYEAPVATASGSGPDAPVHTLEPTLDLSPWMPARYRTLPSWRYSDREQAYALDEPVGDGRDVRSYRSLLIVGPPDAQPRARLENLGEAAAAPPLRFREGSIVATAAGRVSLVEPGTGKRLAEPFLPPLVAGTQIRWSDAVVAGDAILIADRDTALYRLELESGEPSRLVARRETELPAPIGPTLAAAGELVWYAETPARIVARRVADFSVVEQRVVDASLLWGPVVAGEGVLAAAESADRSTLEIYVWNSAGKFLKSTSLDVATDGRPELPVALDGRPYIAMSAGDLLRIDPATGEIAARIGLGTGPADPPVVAGGKLFIISSAAELLQLESP